MPNTGIKSMKAYIVTGLGYGDEGKGTVTHWLASKHRAHTVIRTGGAQALHRVVTSDGKEHVFSQFGSGTLRGASTHLSKHMVIDPHALINEGEELLYQGGVRSIFETMTIHEDALVITPFQALAGRVRELMRGKHRLGSVGMGIGETVSDSELLGDCAIRAKDLSSSALRKKLKAIQRIKVAEFEELADRTSIIHAEVETLVRSELAKLANPDTVEWAIERFTDLTKKVAVVNTEYVQKCILGLPGTVVFEGSQGVLLDRLFGFHPFTTKVRTLPAMANAILDECGYQGERLSLGVLRAYHTRHGGGPFVCESSDLTEQLPDALNHKHPWQGSFRVGCFDSVAARYAINACGGTIDGVVVTCLDRIQALKSWSVCNKYSVLDKPVSSELFRQDKQHITEIKVKTCRTVTQQLARQTKIGQTLSCCRPQSTTFDIAALNRREWTDLCISEVEKAVTVPVVAVSFGETDKDKIVVG